MGHLVGQPATTLSSSSSQLSPLHRPASHHPVFIVQPDLSHHTTHTHHPRPTSHPYHHHPPLTLFGPPRPSPSPPPAPPQIQISRGTSAARTPRTPALGMGSPAAWDSPSKELTQDVGGGGGKDAGSPELGWVLQRGGRRGLGAGGRGGARGGERRWGREGGRGE